MPDYDLSSLSTRSFEKLIQSIAGKVLGLGTVTFGDGPDGGREAVFEGRMDYPSTADSWAGYCVIQAKFLQRPKNSSSDGRWALKQLEEELKTFAAPEKRRRRPDYYVFATNVVLTPVQDRGWKDRAAALFKKYQKKVPLRGSAMWDFDEICKFLDNSADIRKAYAAWITSGDVLSEVMQWLGPKRADFLEVMTNFLAKELRSDQFANLEQAGHSTEERIPLARVFVDLPVTRRRVTEPVPDEAEGREGLTELVGTLMERARDPLDPASILQGQFPPEGRPTRPEGPQPGRYVLVGGPGQGKTTVGQFACQLFRVALLQDRPPHLLPPEVRELLAAFLDQYRAGLLLVPKARRFPVRMVLSEFATALNADRDLSLLAFIARQIERRTGRTVSPDDLRNWLSAYPWFLVLDGLDEVPPSTNREEVLKKVEDFWIDATQANADVLVLATTRPQGYSEDFSTAYYHHLWLTPLSPQRAMKYARRLVDMRYVGEPDRQQKILTRLEQASGQEATARLMRSPLQITIMAALVDQTGTPPQDRWRLFHDYYEVIYSRERERPIPAAELLREYKPNIDAIHHQVGLTLQVENERAGGAEAKLPADRFAKLVTTRLEEEEFSGQALHKLRDRIIDAAANRLVFLVGLEAGQVGFEIRSLQEYMAAEAIMTGGQEKIQERLRRFAPIASWRNVFLFAAGRCFLQEQHLRDTIHTICVELNDQLAGPVGRATLAGSALALDLLEDGVARRQPKYARLLAQCATHLLELPPAEIHARLADTCEGETEAVVRETLERAVTAPGAESLPAWAALLALVGRGLRWASELAERSWPSDPSQQLALLALPTAERAVGWMGPRFETAVEQNPASQVWRVWRTGHSRRARHDDRRQQPTPFYAMWDLWDYWYSDYSHFEEPRIRISAGLSCLLTPIPLATQFASRVNLPSRDVHPTWLSTIEELKFCRQPSKQALADGLGRLAKVAKAFPFHVPSFRPALSWVFGSCLASVDSSVELDELAERAARGDLGDASDWVEAERRWKEGGVTLEDLLYLTNDHWPFDREIARRGFPIAVARILPEPVAASAIEELLDRISNVPRVEVALATALLPQLGMLAWPPGPGPRPGPRGSPAVQPQLVLRLLRLATDRWFPYDIALAAAQWALSDARWLDVLDEVGRTTTGALLVYRPVYVEERSEGLRALSTLFTTHPDHANLLPLIVAVLTGSPFASTPKPDTLSLPRVHYEHYDDPKIRWAAVVLELIQEGLQEDRAGELAVITTTLESQGVANLQHALGGLARRERLDQATDHYLLQLRRQLSDAKSQSNIVAALNDSLRRRSSEVTDPRVWRSLALPETLLDLMATSPS